MWVDDAFLREHDVQPWTDLPLWIPESAAIPGLLSVNVAAARNAGLTLRPLAETIADTGAWLTTRSTNHAWKAGLDLKRETELLAIWMGGTRSNDR